jgi:hypothetical protein
MTDTPVPQMPGFFQAYLAGLTGPAAQAMYEWVVSAGPSNYVSLAIQDATQGRGNDVYGEGV